MARKSSYVPDTFLKGIPGLPDAVVCFSKEINHLSKPGGEEKKNKKPRDIFLIYLVRCTLTISKTNFGALETNGI